ncbi:cilia- and flagella-associated protein 251-like isoform X4 [Aphis gossypii]|uniref:cilia- and flagella-associated protein 251-like isoform X4 n=1 Tax=Aphis gossypii TaxID=80765 RepID=UPI0021595132|nr:cilia- and flagella-associated protein 251-like isoform X4 [Aphis gossypii]
MTNNNQTRFQILRNPNKSADIFENHIDSPLKPLWTFGWNCKIGLKSILNEDFNETNSLQIFFVTDQIGIVFEFNTINKEKCMNMLTGHRNYISSFDVNPDGCWFVTVDKGDDSMLIVWNSSLRVPVFSVLSPFKIGISIVKFSIDSQYVITISVADTNGEQTISIWEWTSGNEESICSTKLDNSIDMIVHLSCCYDNTNFYCLTTEKLVFFMTLEKMDININKQNSQKNVDYTIKIIITIPAQDLMQKKYNYTQSTYLTNSRQVFSASTGGWVTVWDDTDYDVMEIANEPITNNKLYLKHVKLDEHSITTLMCIQNHIITGNTNGDIFFYEKSLRVLYHLNMFVGDPISSIAIIGNQIHVENEKENSSTDKNSEEVTKKIISLDDDSMSWCDISPEIGADFTASQDFKCSPLCISTRNCKIYYIDITNKNFDYIFEQCEVEFITALSVHPNRSELVMGNSIGGLVVFNYRKKKIVNRVIGNQEFKEDHQVTCIKYSPNGIYLCYGRADGLFEFIDPYSLMNKMENTSFNWNKSPVKHITFNESSTYVVYTDNLFGIYLYGITQLQNPDEFSVKYYGCYEVHEGIIRNILITESKNNLLIYSLGVDHRIIALDFDKTKDNEHPKLVKMMRTESYNEPLYMMKSTINRDKLNFIISGNDLRLSLWNDKRCICTTLGVNLENPIRVMKESPKFSNNIFFCTDTDIGILRQPIDGNPYKNAAVLGSGTKIIDIDVSMDSMYLFVINENSSAMIIWSVHLNYLDKLEKHGGVGLKAYSSLLEGGENGPEITELKEYFSCVQLANSRNPETTVISDYVDVYNLSFLMRAMGYFPSETEVN